MRASISPSIKWNKVSWVIQSVCGKNELKTSVAGTDNPQLPPHSPTKERGNPTSSLALISHGIFFIGTEISRTGSWMMQSESPIDSPMASRNTKSECLLLPKAPLVTLNEYSGLRGQSPADGQGTGHALSRNTETNPPYFSSGGMKTICHVSKHLTIPLRSILWARPRGELPTWRSRQVPTGPAGRGRHPWLLPGAPPRLATGGVFRAWGCWGPCTQHVLGLRDHPIIPLWNTNGPDAEGAIESWWKQYRASRSHLLNIYHMLGMPLGLHHSKPNLWLSFSF